MIFYPKFGAEYRRLHNPKKGKNSQKKMKKIQNSSDLAL